ncbi:pentatricopeptide repeat-containing protein At4g20740 [Cynara cardunculus var. scolymus]|uniref:Pentatricopeptide repeat-containing protein n=1 Tax=Cynara cardunculus var. scolymus TaxID=59895 RepID=A0A103Y1F7_CYNCS|nr:pentatricopeptide repeat-containing protein At4g20740 [Cynara cardunculus var. scolymus]XP_024984313.1 pentatricopeptide repeat-containing protein At4g20740 [Cynara cardunculus var. scolymus]KVI00772.1 Pentatricopeptide repeat-containing protein [Cynara cardunculus var. scolymus]
MPPQAPPPTTVPRRFNFIYGHRKPTQNRPIVRGGIFSNRQILFPNQNHEQATTNFELEKWNPQQSVTAPPPPLSPSQHFFSVAQTLSPIARYIVDSFRKHKHWGPPVVADLNKLRRVTPKLVAEVLKVQSDPNISSKFFHWAGKQKGYKHDFASYNAFSYCLNRNNQFRAADQVPELMNMQGKPPTEKQFEILIRMHSDANRGLRVYYAYEKMKKFGVKPRVFLYNRIMDALVKTDHLDLSMSVYNDFKNDKLVEEGITFMILVKGLCKAGRIEEALELLGRMRKLCKPDVFAYTAMIKILVSEGNLDGCLRVWQEMESDKVQPDVLAYATLVMGLCKGNRVEKGYELFKEMKEKCYLIDRAIYGSLIEGFVNDRKVGVACDLLKDLIESGYRADLVIYNHLIKGLCNMKHVTKAHKLFQVTVEEDLRPDFETVNPMLFSYAELRKFDEFCKLLVQIQGLGFRVMNDLVKFFSLMVGQERDGAVIALEVFNNLKPKGYCTVPIYNILIGALHKIGEVKKALMFFHELKESKMEPNSCTYSNAILCFVETGEIHEACSCYNEIKEMSSIPSIDAYVSLVKGLCKIGEIDDAFMVVRDCLANVTSGPREFKYTLRIIHICRSNDANKVMGVINEMVEDGCSPDDVIFCAVIAGMCRYGTIEEGRKVFSSMRECKMLTESDLVVYDDLLIDHMKKKTADLVLSGLKFFRLESKLKAKGSNLLPS